MTINPENILLQPCDFIVGRTMSQPEGYTCNTSSVVQIDLPDCTYFLCSEHQPKQIFKMRR